MFIFNIPLFLFFFFFMPDYFRVTKMMCLLLKMSIYNPNIKINNYLIIISIYFILKFFKGFIVK